MPLNIETRETGDVTFVDLDGRIVLGGESNRLRECVSALLAGKKQKIVLNMSNVSFIDSAGVGALVSCLRSAQTKQATLKLCSLTPQTRAVLTITKLISIFGVTDDESMALQSFSS